MRDLVTHGLNRLAFQFKESHKLKDLISVQLDGFQTLDNTFNDLLDNRLLDNAIGQQLDGIGEILGYPRPFLSVDVQNVFGFFSDPTALGFTDINDTTLGGNFVEFAATRQLANDETYRKLLKAKAVINRTSMTVEETLDMLSIMFDGTRVRYTLPTNLEPTYTIERVLTTAEIGLIDVLPKLIGIDNITYVTIDTFSQFGFDGDPDALGFTDINNIELGGNFASII